MPPRAGKKTGAFCASGQESIKAMFIEWKDEYMIGHKLIDFDHQMLVHMTNELFVRVESNSETDDEVAQALAALVEYVKRHFAREEDIFLGTEYPGKHEHLRKHREITKTVSDIAAAYKADPSSINMDEVMEFLRVWLTNHFLRTDQSYIEYLVLASYK